MTINNEGISQPQDDDFLWRYIRPERIDSFLRGDIYFPALMDFEDQHEAISPLHSILYKFLTDNAHSKFDLQTPLGEQDRETVPGTMMMWLALYDLEKKLLALNLVKDRSEIQDLLFNYLGNSENLHGPHMETLTRYYSSCWFVGKYEESALMWTSYSKPGGIAVRIRFEDFKKALGSYFLPMMPIYGIGEVRSGLIEYIDHAIDYQVWNEKIMSGIPLAFFKQHHFREEREYRILLKRDDLTPDGDFNRLHPILSSLESYDIIFHPSSWLNEYQALKAKLGGKERVDLLYSKIRFNRPKAT